MESTDLIAEQRTLNPRVGGFKSLAAHPAVVALTWYYTRFGRPRGGRFGATREVHRTRLIILSALGGPWLLPEAGQVDLDREGRGGLDESGEYLAVPVPPARRVVQVGVHDRDACRGQLHAPVEENACACVLVELHDPVGGLRARRDDLRHQQHVLGAGGRHVDGVGPVYDD